MLKIFSIVIRSYTHLERRLHCQCNEAGSIPARIVCFCSSVVERIFGKDKTAVQFRPEASGSVGKLENPPRLDRGSL